MLKPLNEESHIIVFGDDALTMRIIDELNDAEVSVVRLASAAGLQAAGVGHAAAVIAASSDDSLNLEVALLARRANAQVRVVTRLSNTVLRQAMNAGEDQCTALDVADLAAPSVVEALLERPVHTIPVGDVDFVISGAAAPRDGTLRDIYGRLAPVAVIRGDNSANPGEVITCPRLDLEVCRGDWVTMMGRSGELAEQGIQPPAAGDAEHRRRSPVDRLLDSVRAFTDDINPTFYRAVAVLGMLLIGSTVILKFHYQQPGMSWVDAVYFSTETLVTVGYGDFNFLNQPVWLRLWGVVMMLGGLATTAIVVAFVADVLLSRRLSQATSRQRVSHLRRHFVVVGLGAFGIRVAGLLKDAGYDVAVIEYNEENRYLSTAAELNIPVILGDATLKATLTAAQVERARALAVLTEDDIVNIEIAIVLREIVGPRRTEDADGPAPSVRRGPIVLRIYDKTLGAAVGHRFGFEHVRSTVDLATPWFIGAAMGLEVLGTFSVGQRSFMVGGVLVEPDSELDGITVDALLPMARVIALARNHQVTDLYPRRSTAFQAGDTIHLVGPYHELLEILRKGRHPAGPD
jgi:Trk K+ transport system NAD-binding subunit